MTTCCFVVGHEDTNDDEGKLLTVSDTPDAFWRVLTPARALGLPAVILGHVGAQERALGADVLWIHQPSSDMAVALIEKARAQGRSVIVDFSEDPWSRAEIGASYLPARLEACATACENASMIVLANRNLAPAFQTFDVRMVMVEPVVPLGPGWIPKPPAEPPILAWWSDARQKRGLSDVALALRTLLVNTDLQMRHIGFAHQAPLVTGLSEAEVKAIAPRLSSYFSDSKNLTAEANMAIFRDAMAPALLSMECYPASQYRETLSELGLLRAAALGVPSLTTRLDIPPGCISAQPDEWEGEISSLLENPAWRRDFSLAARSWAQSRSSFTAYQNAIEEVL